MADTRYRGMEPGDEGPAGELIDRVFRAQVAPLFSAEGVAEFFRYLEPEAWRRRLETGPPAFVAEQGKFLVGVIEGHGAGHISLLFVAGGEQGKGVGRELVRLIAEEFRRRLPGLGSLEVHASPNAVGAYERFGFRISEPERVVHGIRFVLMERPLA
jgi:ribosomal protein S18 acetylase RimI-like enzyme